MYIKCLALCLAAINTQYLLAIVTVSLLFSNMLRAKQSLEGQMRLREGRHRSREALESRRQDRAHASGCLGGGLGEWRALRGAARAQIPKALLAMLRRPGFGGSGKPLEN